MASFESSLEGEAHLNICTFPPIIRTCLAFRQWSCERNLCVCVCEFPLQARLARGGSRGSRVRGQAVPAI
eukprot:605319-Amphidinium_carterae.1